LSEQTAVGHASFFIHKNSSLLCFCFMSEKNMSLLKVPVYVFECW
jgi:hypothetical protein